MVPAGPAAMHDAVGDGRAVQLTARMDAADCRAVDRLYPYPRIPGGRSDTVPQDRGDGRSIRRANGMAWSGRCLADRACGEHCAVAGLLQLRRAGIEPVQ